jgi:hypothetical protein
VPHWTGHCLLCYPGLNAQALGVRSLGPCSLWWIAQGKTRGKSEAVAVVGMFDERKEVFDHCTQSIEMVHTLCWAYGPWLPYGSL